MVFRPRRITGNGYRSGRNGLYGSNNLSKDDLVKIVLSYQGQFEDTLKEIKNDINGIKPRYEKFKSDLNLTRKG